LGRKGGRGGTKTRDLPSQEGKAWEIKKRTISQKKIKLAKRGERKSSIAHSTKPKKKGVVK